MGNVCLKRNRTEKGNAYNKNIAIVEEAASKYKAEYKKICAADVYFHVRELERYRIIKDTIRFLPIEDQAQYADYVTKRLTSEIPIEVLLSYLVRHADSLPMSFEDFSPPAIGNTALLLMTLPSSPFKSNAIMKFRSALHASY